jgi:hypothetical protein
MWVGSNEGPAGGPCPYCGQPMKVSAQGVAFCHLCQEVWVPATFAMPAPTTAAGAVPAAPVATHCDNCGAPLEPDEMGRCKFCHAQIAAPQPIVVEIQSAPVAHPSVRTGSRLLDGLVDLLTDPL